MQKKKGISLIVLIITIIVMVILATAIIITLDNAGIINKSKDAVEQTNLKQVQQLASLAWAEAYMDGKTTQADLEKAVLDALDKNKIDKSKYNITVTTDGVDVQLKNSELNEYGFYYGELYKGQDEIDGGFISAGFVFYENGTAEQYVSADAYGLSGEGSEKLYWYGILEGSASYSKGQITVKYEDDMELVFAVSNDGKSIEVEGDVLTCSFEEIKGIQKGVTYTGTYQDASSQEIAISLKVATDNTATLTYGDYSTVTSQVEYIANDKGFTFDTTLGSTATTLEGLVSVDGSHLVLGGNNLIVILKATEVVDDTEQDKTEDNSGLYDADGNLVASWDTLVNTYGLDVEKDYTSDNLLSSTTAMSYILQNNTTLSGGVNLVIADGIEKIGDYALAYVPLTSVTLPDTVKSIGAWGIGFNTITSVTIPYGLETIGESAFAMASKLTEIEIPNSVKTIGGNALFATDITSLHIPASVTSIGYAITRWCEELTSITVDSANTAYKSINDAIYTIDGKTLLQYAAGKTGSLSIPDGVTTIGLRAISYCKVSTISLPSSVTTVGNMAFEECPNLTTITFADNTNLTTVGSYAFATNPNLTAVTFPQNTNIQSLGEYAFADNPKLTNVYIPEGLTTLEKYTFRSCTKLESVTLPSTLVTLKSYVFSGCDALTSLTLPASVASIGYSVLDGETDLKLLGSTPPTFPDGVGITLNLYMTITVPKGSGDVYKAAEGWSPYFDNIVEATE